MRLRSRTYITSGSVVASRVSSQASKTQPQPHLAVINKEGLSSRESKTWTVRSSENTAKMGTSNESGGHRNPFRDDPTPATSSSPFQTKILFVCVNAHGANIYCDPSNQYLVQMGPPFASQPSEVMATFQGDHYLSANGTVYRHTFFSHEMNGSGLRLHGMDARAQTEPVKAFERGSPSHRRTSTAPPWSSGDPDKRVQEEVDSFSTHPAHEASCLIPMKRIHAYQTGMAVYMGNEGEVYQTVCLEGYPYPHEQVLYGFALADGTLEVRDVWSNLYEVASPNIEGHQGIGDERTFDMAFPTIDRQLPSGLPRPTFPSADTRKGGHQEVMEPAQRLRYMRCQDDPQISLGQRSMKQQLHGGRRTIVITMMLPTDEFRPGTERRSQVQEEGAEEKTPTQE